MGKKHGGKSHKNKKSPEEKWEKAQAKLLRRQKRRPREEPQALLPFDPDQMRQECAPPHLWTLIFGRGGSNDSCDI